MSEWKAKRFWKTTSAEAADAGWRVLLDAREVKTPAKAPLRLPTQALAKAIAAEWDAQEEEIAPLSMPLTRAANAALDKVIPQRDGVIDALAAYGGTDLLCYRAEAPPALFQREAAAWDPMLDWAASTLGARLLPVQGVIPVSQDRKALAALRGHLEAASDFELTALHDLVMLSGSLVLGLAVWRGELSGAEAWALSRIDEEWQAEQWGRDEDADALADAKRAQLLNAERLLELL